MAVEQKKEIKKIYPKRFIDRRDRSEIIKESSGFSKRGHEHVPNWMVNLFVIMQLVFVGVMLYFAYNVINSQQHQSEVLSIIQYMLICFVVVTTYSLFIVKKLKGVLSATEFMSLFLSKSLESYSSCYAILNSKGKIIYYNDSFANNFMISDDVEKLTYQDILDKDIFEEKYISKITETIENKVETSFSLVSSTSNSQTMRNVRIVPLTRPEGLFVLKVITVEIVKAKKTA
jgi:hypothetical protein